MARFVDDYDAALAGRGAQPNYTLSNHDRPRVTHRGEGAARLAAMLLLTLRGTPFLYYGEEIGMPNVEVPSEKRRDPFVVPETGLSRDQSRTPMRWDGSGPNAGFCPEGVEPWLPVGPDVREANVAVQTEDPASVLTLHRRLLALRRENSMLSSGTYERLLDGVPDDCFAYLRRHGEGVALIALNFSEEERTVRTPKWAGLRLALSTRLDRKGEHKDSLDLRPQEGAVLLRASLPTRDRGRGEGSEK